MQHLIQIHVFFCIFLSLSHIARVVFNCFVLQSSFIFNIFILFCKRKNIVYNCNLDYDSCAAYLTRLTLLTRHLPTKLFSVGTCYTPAYDLDANQFDLCSRLQQTVVRIQNWFHDVVFYFICLISILF